MSSPPWMPFNVADYLADTGHLTVAEHGAYLLLIMRYWQDGGLPADEKLVARYAHMSVEQWAESRDVLAALFDDGWSHKRINAELAKATEIIGKRSNAAKARHAKTPDASAVHVDSTSSHTGVPHQHTQQEDAADPRKRSRAELDRIEADLREASGMQTNPSPGLMVLAPILGLLDSGYDIEADILSTVRAVSSRMKRPARSWDYFVEPIREAAADRRSVAAKGPAPPGRQQQPNGRTNVFERLKGQVDGRGGQDGSTGPVVDAVRSIPDLRGQDERDDGQGVPAGDRWVLASRAS